ncbi:hypothetical protein HYDPIDRAFT_24489 [Hydnomerulius pinastri MD-312]|uniref:Uncharacterized protein n=1 Tax=Hydnomerulius pinastri MD-312 TaxID=994086 RepID=A0A0C9WG88_9AGAM|nr:hypothetical protein HYDPIDRAFT_110903 [Hydnomerulius pinastri MD-312]KIJ68188.1 hypothetical protein HYDPIDRAFT_24489 [Hydnomerulius pinastri MD-312]
MRPGGLFTSALLSLCFLSQVIAAPAHASPAHASPAHTSPAHTTSAHTSAHTTSAHTTSTHTTSTHTTSTVAPVPSAATLSCSCPSNSYVSTDITGAINKAVSRGLQTGRSYPHQFNNREGFKFSSCSGKLAEYPIFGGSVYSGSGSPGGDRVIYEQGSNTFCGCIAHPAASSGSFVQCT